MPDSNFEAMIAALLRQGPEHGISERRLREVISEWWPTIPNGELFFHPAHKFTGLMEELTFHVADCLECKTGLSFMVRFLLDEFPVLKGALLMSGVKESDITNSLLSANREILENKLKENEQWQRFKNLVNTGSV